LGVYSRNLTPDKTGLPEGGHTFREFLEIMRHGKITTMFTRIVPAPTLPPTASRLPSMAIYCR
jgi:hypothetical protein